MCDGELHPTGVENHSISNSPALSFALSADEKSVRNNFSKWMRNLLLVARRTLVATGLLLTATTAEPLLGVGHAAARAPLLWGVGRGAAMLTLAHGHHGAALPPTRWLRPSIPQVTIGGHRGWKNTAGHGAARPGDEIR